DHCQSPIHRNEKQCIEQFFFFSSRRRHTRFSRDWSSDVCSSDLTQRHVKHGRTGAEHFPPEIRHELAPVGNHRSKVGGRRLDARSEERRVGKECNYPWSMARKKRKRKRKIPMYSTNISDSTM